MRVIPRRTKVKMEFFRNITLADILLGIVVLAVTILLLVSNIPYKIFITLAWVAFGVCFFIPIADGVRLYASFGILFRFFAYKKKYSKEKTKKAMPIKNLIPYEKLEADKYINYGDYFAEVIEITPMEFGLLNEYKQNLMIENFANALRRLSNTQTASIVKISKAMILDHYAYSEDKKYDNLLELNYEGEINDKELEARSAVFESRVSSIESRNREDKVFKDFFYMVIYDKDKETLEGTVDGIISTLVNSPTPLYTKRLIGQDLIVFLKANFGKDFDERELELIPMSEHIKWTEPDSVNFRVGSTLIDKKPYKQFLVTDYPLSVGNAWASNIFSLERTKVVMNITPIPKEQAERNIDKAIVEMETKFLYSSKSSRRIENETHLETLRELLVSLKNNNQQLYDVNTYLMCEESAKKEVRAQLRQNGFKFSELFGRQVDGFVSSNISRLDRIKEFNNGIPTSTLAAAFPFISGAFQDENGFYIGYNEYPVFIDLFTRNRERVNSNVMVIGKSGSGKSFATKTLLCNLAADNAKIFILDPEDEYTILAKNLAGKSIDVGSSAMGIINPFHIMSTLEADEGVSDDSYSIHLQFLEQFFKIILEGMNSDSFELLNTLIVEMYNEKGINGKTKLTDLTPDDFPIFDDLYRIICKKVDTEKDEYFRRNLLTIKTYIQKFSTGGRNSNLWNGPTSIVTKENFITFSFRSLLANRNQIIANAQMLLVFKYLDNEIIKNKDFNDKFHMKRKIIVAVDEAHVFINPKFPIALDFMAQMAKRIRKYSGMQIVITQNVKDFVGSPEIERQSSAVINASQYSFIFSLAPNDISDLVELYRKAGEINEEEQNSIVSAGIGQCFLISSPSSRTMIQIEALDAVKDLFEKNNG